MSTTPTKKKSWLTTLFGWIAGISAIVAQTSHDPKTQAIAGTVSGVAITLLGTNARDNKVSSEDAGAK